MAEMSLSAARKSQPYHGTNLVLGAPFAHEFKQPLSSIMEALKKRMDPFGLAGLVSPHHSDGFHATVTIFWEKDPITIDEDALRAWFQNQPSFTLRVVSNAVTRTPFIISSNGLIVMLAQGNGEGIKSIREQVGIACNITDKNRTKSTCHIVLGYLQPNEGWNNQKVVDQIVDFVQEVNVGIDLECQVKEVSLITYNKQTLEPSAITAATRFPLK